MELRAKTVKGILSDTENLKVKLENKDEDIKELKKQLRFKVGILLNCATYLLSMKLAP